MALTERAKTPLKLLAFAVGGYLVVSVVSGGIGVSLPMPSLPSISLPTLAGTDYVLVAIVGLGGVYALATKRGWRQDVRYLIQLVALVLIAYLVGRAFGPMVWGALPV